MNDMDNPKDWFDLAKQLGVNTTFIIGILYVLWKALKAVGQFSKPVIEKLVEKHIELVNKLEDSLDKVIDATSKNTDLQLSQAEISKGHSVLMEKQSILLESQTSMMKELSHIMLEHHKSAQEFIKKSESK